MAHVTSGEALEDKVLDSKQQNQHEGADDQNAFTQCGAPVVDSRPGSEVSASLVMDVAQTAMLMSPFGVLRGCQACKSDDGAPSGVASAGHPSSWRAGGRGRAAVADLRCGRGSHSGCSQVVTDPCAALEFISSTPRFQHAKLSGACGRLAGLLRINARERADPDHPRPSAVPQRLGARRGPGSPWRASW